MTFTCPKCGTDRIILSTTNLLPDETICFMCKTQMLPDKGDIQPPIEAEIQDPKLDVLEPSWITSIRHEIKTVGNEKVWEFIESYKNPKIRLEYRRLFFKAGGEIN